MVSSLGKNPFERYEDQRVCRGGGEGHRVGSKRLLAKHRRLKFKPGTCAGYSNLGYLILGEVVFEVSGADHEEYVRDEILMPLRMDEPILSERTNDLPRPTQTRLYFPA